MAFLLLYGKLFRSHWGNAMWDVQGQIVGLAECLLEECQAGAGGMFAGIKTFQSEFHQST